MNDVCSLIPWTGLYSLYGNMSKATINSNRLSNQNSLAKDLNVDPKLLKAVINPSHLNISYMNTIHGIEFKSIFTSIEIPIILIYSKDSKLVNEVAITNIKKYSENLELIESKGSNHPVKFDKLIVEKLRKLLFKFHIN